MNVDSLRTHKVELSEIASYYDVNVSEVRSVIKSYFDSIIKPLDSLRLYNEGKIYSKDAFNKIVFASNIPFIGRLGLVYNRYLKWRINEAKSQVQRDRSEYHDRVSQDDIEHIAVDILSGKTPNKIKKIKGKDIYKRVWYVNVDSKCLARQIILKDKKKSDV